MSAETRADAASDKSRGRTQKPKTQTLSRSQGWRVQRLPQIRAEVAPRNPKPRPFLADNSQVSLSGPKGPEAASHKSKSHTQNPKPQTLDWRYQPSRQLSQRVHRVPQIRAEVTPRTPNPRPFLADASQVSPAFATGPEGASDQSRSHTQNRKPQTLLQIIAKSRQGSQGLKRLPQIRAEVTPRHQDPDPFSQITIKCRQGEPRLRIRLLLRRYFSETKTQNRQAPN